MRSFSLVFCGSFTLFTVIECSYNHRVQELPNGLRITPVFRNTKLPTQQRTIWIDTFIFEDIGIQAQILTKNHNTYWKKWGDKAELKITTIDNNCELFELKTVLDKRLSVAFNLEDIQLYGGTELEYQTWPTQKTSFDDSFVTHSNNARAVVEPYWLDSKGQYVYVDKTVPLFVSQNKTTLELIAELRDPYIRQHNQTLLKYTLCTFPNAKIAHMDAVKRVLGKPTKVPDFTSIKYPIWSTWAAYKVDVNDTAVREYADAIQKRGFPNSALEIDDNWETCYGSFKFNITRFPDIKGLVSDLKRAGYRVTLWVHPFINVGCERVYTEALELGYFVKSNTDSVITTWWNGKAAVIDFTNPKAAKWWVNRLQNLQQETGLDSFKFDAGESSWLPQLPIFSEMSDDHPETIVRAYVNTANEFGPMIEVRTSRGTQDISPFVRMIDRETTWTGRLSLETLIPTLLQMNIVGYPFVLPDMIGGNGYDGEELTEEMFVRWLQISTFMPVLQFSLPPWKFNQRILDITKHFIDLHAKYANLIYNLTIKATVDGTPVNLPLWWIAPNDPKTYTIDSEFLLGEDILVAPVITKGAKSRDIYLPEGTWQDENDPSGPRIKGPVMVFGYRADLDILPFFTRINT